MSKKDPYLARIWVIIVMVFNSAAVCYSVYFDWIYSIISFTTSQSALPSVVNGNLVILYSTVVM